ncbi:MAG: serine/threonine-protein kinase, partial [Thermomicrobiales bacterium]
PKLIDFGLAKDLGAPGAALTATSQRPGTVRYMAPEQARGAGDIDGRADLYAVGVLLYHALSGQWPYDVTSDPAWLDALVAGTPIVPLCARCPEVPSALAAVVDRALAGERSARYQGAQAMCDALREAMEQPEVGTTFGAYRLIREVGRGGMGVVYEAEQVTLRRRVAIKRMLARYAADPEMRERFLREGRAAARVKHPHVVDVTDAGCVGEVPYLAMEYLEGETLAARLLTRGKLTLREMADVMVPVCDAVASAHRAGVLHRDLKPSNVMLARGEGAEVPKVVDFGIARMLDSTEGLTASGELVGTRGYLAPELLRDGAKAASAASDIYALGVIAHECLTGRRASDAEDVAVGEGPPEVAEAMRRCLARAPDGRQASAWELARALLPHAGAAVRARWGLIVVGLEATESRRAWAGSATVCRRGDRGDPRSSSPWRRWRGVFGPPAEVWVCRPCTRRLPAERHGDSPSR